MVQPPDLHLVNVGSIPTGLTHGEGRLQPHPRDELKATPNIRKSPRSGLNLEGKLTDPKKSLVGSVPVLAGPGTCTISTQLNQTKAFSSAEQQPAISAAALSEEFLRLLMWGATMAWEAGEICWE